MHVSASVTSAFLLLACVPGMAAKDVRMAPALFLQNAAALQNGEQCNAGCIPEGIKKKVGQPLCCTEGRTTYKCPKPAHYECGPAPPTPPAKNALWFRNVVSACGEIDAAPFMGSDIFLPENSNALREYIMVTIAGANKLGYNNFEVGRCADEDYTVPAGSRQINWDDYANMRLACGTYCRCDFPSYGESDCTNKPDQPRKHQFCSLCGSKYDIKGTVMLFSKPAPKNLVQLAQSVPSLSTLVTAIVAANLTATLSARGSFTVIAPNNDAFEKLPFGVLKNLLKPENIRKLVELLELHVVAQELPFKTLLKYAVSGQTIKTVDGQELSFTTNNGTVYVTGGLTKAAKIIAPDNEASNGVAHIVDTVLLPDHPPPPLPPSCDPDTCTVCEACCKSFISGQANCDECAEEKCPGGIGTIVALAVATPDLSTLVAALTAGDLVSTLSGTGPFTVFAPTNDAFAALPAGALAKLLLPQNKPQLVDILTYHVVSGTVLAKDLKDGDELKTLEGKSLMVRVVGGTILIDSSRVTAANLLASNGVVHTIDKVLSPL